MEIFGNDQEEDLNGKILIVNDHKTEGKITIRVCERSRSGNNSRDNEPVT